MSNPMQGIDITRKLEAECFLNFFSLQYKSFLRPHLHYSDAVYVKRDLGFESAKFR